LSTISEVCKWCGISATTFHKAVKRGVIARKPRGEHDLQEVARALIRDGQAAKGGHGDLVAKLKLSEARAALAREQTVALRLKNAVARGDYVRRAGIRREIDAMLSMLRERLLSVAGKISVPGDMLPGGEVEATIRTEICEALDEILPFASTIIEHRGH
jgi:phage terminase Nu1 subunit (DNA packaging protein)